jgi:hypothetical protein
VLGIALAELIQAHDRPKVHLRRHGTACGAVFRTRGIAARPSAFADRARWPLPDSLPPWICVKKREVHLRR